MVRDGEEPTVSNTQATPYGLDPIYSTLSTVVQARVPSEDCLHEQRTLWASMLRAERIPSQPFEGDI